MYSSCNLLPTLLLSTIEANRKSLLELSRRFVLYFVSATLLLSCLKVKYLIKCDKLMVTCDWLNLQRHAGMNLHIFSSRRIKLACVPAG